MPMRRSKTTRAETRNWTLLFFGLMSEIEDLKGIAGMVFGKVHLHVLSSQLTCECFFTIGTYLLEKTPKTVTRLFRFFKIKKTLPSGNFG